MSILQISKIQQRSGNLVDLPQLDEAEFGWASDERRLFIGKTTPNENVEVLTGYSKISFSQIDGAVGNIVISSAINGQILTYDGTNWVNRGGIAGGLITLGDVANVKITGGAIGYILETDGLGNLSWTPKGTLYSNIVGLSNANPIVMTVNSSVPYTNDLKVTITGVNGNANSIVNGKTFYIQLANDYPTSGNVTLYEGAGAVNPVNGAGLTYTNSPNAIATAVVAGGGTGTTAAGSEYTIQYNSNSILQGSADFTYNDSTKLFNLNGNANVLTLNASGPVSASRFISNVSTGTAPLTVTSTTKVDNLNADLLDGFNTATAATANTVVVRDSTGSITGNLLTGTLTTNAQPNITSLGSLTSLTVVGNANVGNLGTTGIVVATGNVSGGNLTTAGALSVTGNATVGNLGTAGVVTATGNVTGGNLITSGGLSVTGNASVGNLGTVGTITATGNITGGNLHAAQVTAGTLVSNVTVGTPPLTVTSTTRVANLNVNYANVSDFAVVTSQTTGIYYPVLVNGSSTANYALAANSGISANIANGTLIATTISGNLVGNVTGNVNGNVTGNLTGNVNGNVTGNLTGNVTGNVTGSISGNITAPGANTQVVFNDAGTLNAISALTVNKTTNNVAISNSLSVSSNISAVNISTSGTITASSNVTGSNIVTAGRVFATTGVQSNATIGGANATLYGNKITSGDNSRPGTIDGIWTLTSGSSLQATYADLAEYYEADDIYEPGTVLMFGGDKEVTIAEDGTNRVAGVVSTNPAYVMNATCPGLLTAIALQGRVPCKVRGKIRKGDMLVSGGFGFARPTPFPTIGTVIGKALEDFDGYEGVIEVAVGRL